MRVTIAHEKGQQEAKRIVDQSAQDLLGRPFARVAGAVPRESHLRVAAGQLRLHVEGPPVVSAPLVHLAVMGRERIEGRLGLGIACQRAAVDAARAQRRLEVPLTDRDLGEWVVGVEEVGFRVQAQ